MWCIECGTKLPDNAKFCFNCGKNLSDILSNQENEDNIQEENVDLSIIEPSNTTEIVEVVEEKVRKTISLGNRIIELPYCSDELVYLQSNLTRLAEAGKNYFLSSYDNKFKDFEGMIEFCGNDVAIYYKRAIELLEAFGNKFGYEDFLNSVMPSITEECTDFLSEVELLEEKYNEVMESVEEEEYRRELRKTTRSTWQGGGFGLKGAIKGAATASVLNFGSGLAHSLVNSVGNASTRGQARGTLRKIYSDKELIKNLADAIESDILNMQDVVLNIIDEVYDIEIEDYYDVDKQDDAIVIYNNIYNKKYKDDELDDKIIEMLTLYPFDSDFYLKALEHRLDKIENLEEYAKYFNIDYDSIREEAIRRIEYKKKIAENLGDAADLFEDILIHNKIYDKLKFEYPKTIVENIAKALEISESSDIINATIEHNEDSLQKFSDAYETYANCCDDLPLIFAHKDKDRGIMVTNEKVYIGNKDENISFNIDQIQEIGAGNTLKIKHEDKVYEASYCPDPALFKYIIYITKYSELSGITDRYRIQDIGGYRYMYNGGGRSLNSNFDNVAEYLEDKLKLNREYHNLKANLTGDLEKDLSIIFDKFKCNRGWYIYESIEDKVRGKFDNALKSYAFITNEVPILFYDTTLFGSAKEGFVVTNKAIYIKEAFEKPTKINIDAIEKIEFGSSVIMINDNIKASLDMMDNIYKDTFRYWFEMLIYRLKVEAKLPEAIRNTPLKNKLNLNKYYSYNENSNNTTNTAANNTTNANVNNGTDANINDVNVGANNGDDANNNDATNASVNNGTYANNYAGENCSGHKNDTNSNNEHTGEGSSHEEQAYEGKTGGGQAGTGQISEGQNGEGQATNSYKIDRTKSLEENVKMILSQYCSDEMRKIISVYNEDSKAELKFTLAAKNYMFPLENDERPIFLFDGSLSEKAKDGYVITNKNIHYKNFLSKPQKRALSELKEFSLNGGTIVFNNNKLTNLNIGGVSKKYREELKIITELTIKLMNVY